MYPLVIGRHAVRPVSDVSDVHAQAMVEFPFKELEGEVTWSEWTSERLVLLRLVMRQ